MKIDFFTHNPDNNSGSYRIWIRDLSRSLNEIGHTSRVLVGDTTIDRVDSDVIILGKSSYLSSSEIRKLFKDAKIGAINIPKDHVDDNIDFVIVGSLEEMCSMSEYDNIFIYPLIEREFENIAIKKHNESDKLRICFHGHYPHLAKFEPSLRQAIDNIAEDIKVDIVVIAGGIPKDFHWIVGRPLKANIEVHQYKLETVSKHIQSCDVGVVPNVTDVMARVPQFKDITSVDQGLYETDYCLRFKNKTNGGRAYVFYQHGIPVIHDMSPSSFEFMTQAESHIFAHDTISWEKSLRKLLDHEYRNKIAQINYNTFKEKYNPLEYAKKLVNFIEDVLCKKR